ncbi:unnamed protein product [Polarella glacialis]|uniref:Urease accessory protein UreD n=2 Tax=Polarella glacialis TaxID=89957 RepID=A0A813HPM5_POLGL|nr:unnamed protein product [Polarella glacialis]
MQRSAVILRSATAALAREPQKGSATLFAEQVCGATALVRVSHASPARLLPMMPAAAERAGGAWCALGSFGGGLLGGDEVDLKISVGAGASLALVTQASTKVYRAKRDKRPAVQRLEACVGAGGLLVFAPDPLVPFAESWYKQRLSFRLQDCKEEADRGAEDGSQEASAPLASASAVVVDWIGAGRVAAGERWAFDSYSSRTEFRWQTESTGGSSSSTASQPDLVEALELGAGNSGLRSAVPESVAGFDAALTVVAAGPRAEAVAARLRIAAVLLAARAGARVAPRHRASTAAEEKAEDAESFELPELSGRIAMGVTAGVKAAGATYGGSVTVARIMADRTEDVYRLLHACLKPLAAALGSAPYSDRVHGHGPMAVDDSRERKQLGVSKGPSASVARSAKASSLTQLSLGQQMALSQLTDATLPTGGFAHSGGVEAASQLGLLGPTGGDQYEQVHDFILSAARSNHQLQGAFAMAAHRAALAAAAFSAHDAAGSSPAGDIPHRHHQGLPPSGDLEPLQEWLKLDSLLHAHLAVNDVACRASSKQGAALARVASHWHTVAHPEVPLPRPLRGHQATVFGLLAARLGLPQEVTLYALAFCGVRDAVSAAVRLNLVGPLRGVELQACILTELSEDLLRHPGRSEAAVAAAVSRAAGSSPLVDCAHAAHDLFEARLFLT